MFNNPFEAFDDRPQKTIFNSMILTHSLLDCLWFIFPCNKNEIDRNTRENHQTAITSFVGASIHWNNCDEDSSYEIEYRPE